MISTIGMLRPEKRQADLLRVVLRLRRHAVPATALVVGMATAATQAYANELRILAAQLGIAEHVVFAGHRADVADLIHASDVVLVPSATEAWSRVVPESFAVRCPVVASNVGGLPEIVRPGDTGWLAGSATSPASPTASCRSAPTPPPPPPPWPMRAATPNRTSAWPARCTARWMLTRTQWRGHRRRRERHPG
ncbi:glycosyltransferase family 4 protein [Achromobacter insuavis]